MSSGRSNQLQLVMQHVNGHELKNIVTHSNFMITKYLHKCTHRASIVIEGTVIERDE